MDDLTRWKIMAGVWWAISIIWMFIAHHWQKKFYRREIERIDAELARREAENEN